MSPAPSPRRSPVSTPPIRPRPPARPLRGLAWLSARATLAARRTKRFARWWLTLGGAATVVALLIPVSTPDPEASARAVLERRAADTLRTAAAMRRAQARSAQADSSLVALRRASETIQPRVRVVRDPRVAAMDAAIANARRTRTAESFAALVAEPAMLAGPRMRALGDTLQLAFEAREQSPLSDAAGQTERDATIRRLGNTMLAIATFRRDALASAGSGDESSGAPTADVADTTAITAATALSAAWRDSVNTATNAYNNALSAIAASASAMRTGSTSRTLSPGLVLLAVLIGGLGLRFALALSREAQAPRLAHVAEAEAAVGAPALAIVRDPLPDGPMRFRPTGVDPFRVLYLGLTATGTRERTLVVTGADPLVIGAVGARLAIAAAADHRTTLVMDVDSEQIMLARIFRAPPEPGYTDSMARAFKWKEVARPVGSSDGLSITMISAGTTRDPVEEGEQTAATRTEFAKFRDGFEFTIIVASLRDLPQAMALVPTSPVVLCGTLGETDVNAFERDGADVAAATQRVHGVVLWDAPLPDLPSRAELAAHLSKQKGRTPGGSFQAVKRIVGKPPSDSNKPL